MTTIAELKQKYAALRMNETDLALADQYGDFLADLESIAQGEVVAWRLVSKIRGLPPGAWTNGTPHNMDCGPRFTIVLAYSAPTAAVEVTDEPAGYYIASFRSGPKGYALWWGPNNAGYTTDIATAGIYPDYQRGYHDANDNVPVPVAFVRALRARTMIDIGDTGNGCLWNEANLRAALVAALGAGKS